ncbi:MAG: hypothetical protein U0798_09110 [Gemmataceae bacterium]
MNALKVRWVLLCSLVTSWPVYSADPVPLHNTKPLTETKDLARVMVDGIHAYLDRELQAAPAKRDELWKKRADEPLEAKRERLRKILGVVEPSSKGKVEFYSDSWENTSITPTETGGPSVFRCRWNVLPGLQSEGVYIKSSEVKVTGLVIAIPDSDQTAEGLAGVGKDLKEVGYGYAYDLARLGCNVYIPSTLNRSDLHSANPRLKRATNQPHREFVQRMAYEMGKTVTGLEVQQVLACLPPKINNEELPIAVIGMGSGGRAALYAAALDDRIQFCQVIGSFGPQEGMGKMPLERNAWGLLREFGDAEVARLIAPRKLIVDTSAQPKWNGPDTTKAGRAGATPGVIEPIPVEDVKAERARIPQSSAGSVHLVENKEKKPDTATLLEVMKAQKEANGIGIVRGIVTNAADPIDVVQKRLLDRDVGFIHSLWRNSEPVRKEYWKNADASSPAAWEKSCDPYRETFHRDIIGKLPDPTMPLNPRSRQVYDEPKYRGFEVVLDVYPDVIASGILLLPKDQKAGERRPVVVCQHGLEGRPTSCIEPEKRVIYNRFAVKLVEKGYVVYCPQNPYIFQDHFRQILRKGNPLKLSLFSFIIRQHQRTLDWLETLPEVDPKRIAFYGLSYGGKTAMRVPAVEKRYCLSICSGDFNEWIGKIVSTELPMSYMYTNEYDMLEFNLGNTFNYAEMANLIAPRPFMVERGHDDGVGIDEMIAYEYAKVRYLYANRLKVPNRTDIEFFPGGHQINGKGTFDFLQKHLNYP